MIPNVEIENAWALLSVAAIILRLVCDFEFQELHLDGFGNTAFMSSPFAPQTTLAILMSSSSITRNSRMSPSPCFRRVNVPLGMCFPSAQYLYSMGDALSKRLWMLSSLKCAAFVSSEFLQRDGSRVRQTPLPVDDHDLLRVSLIAGILPRSAMCDRFRAQGTSWGLGPFKTSSLLGAVHPTDAKCVPD